ncbi:MAG: hypothetical protein ACREA9_26785 [Pyrinomonadaceae bacterium]
MSFKNPLAVTAAVVIVASLASPISAVDQPRMQAANVDLQNAHNSLRKASADKGGHRERAMDLVAQAITAVNNGIEYDRTHFTPGRRRHDGDFDEDSFLPTGTPVDQPHMMNARASLQSAIANLNHASADKGGYREQALGLTRRALDEVNAGIEYDRTHLSSNHDEH